MKAVSIFRPGTHTSAAGATLSFSDSDLEATIRAYDPAKHEAPLVVGHPKDNGPAYGWVKGLAFSDGELVAEVHQVEPQFAELVASGRFKKRSASFYSPDSPSNPVPGVYYLRHVGFLGAQPPAVKGLKEVAFADAEEGVVEFSDDAVTLSLVARIFRGLRDTLLAKWGQDETDKALPSYLVEDLEAEARRAREAVTAEPAMPAFNEPQSEDHPMSLTPEQLADLQAKAAKAEQLERENAEFKEREAKAARAAKVAGFKAELAELVAAGKVLPGKVDALAEFMARLDDGEGVAEFGEVEDGKPTTALGFLRGFLKDMPKAVDFSEVSGGAAGGGEPSNAAELAERARKYQADAARAGRHISFTEAVDAVTAGRDKPNT